MLRATWEKSSRNPWIRAISALERPSLPVVRKLVFPRPGSEHPFTAYLYFALPERELENQRELILDFPGGGFICMGPLDHEERLRRWAIRTGKPVLAVDYHKAPECKVLNCLKAVTETRDLQSHIRLRSTSRLNSTSS